MTGHLARLACRATQSSSVSAGGLRPRTPSLFERPSSAPGLVDEYAVESPSTDPSAGPVRADAPEARRQALATPLTPGSPGVLRPESISPHDEHGQQPGSTPMSATDTRPAEPLTATAAAEGGSHTTTPPEPSSATDPVTLDRRLLVEQVTNVVAEKLPDLVAAAPDAGAPAAPSVNTAHAGHDQPTRHRASRETTASVGAATGPVGVVVPAGHPDTLRPSRERSAPASSPVPLPRLTPTPPVEDKPGVTVNIGRIEVVPPPKATPPAARPAGKRETGAPRLADYLRDRSRR